MRYKGYRSIEKERRDKDLYALYKRIVFDAEELSCKDIVEEIYNSPAPRFYVCVKTAVEAVQAILKGGRISRMLPERQRMYAEIFRRFLDRHEVFPEHSVEEVVSFVIQQQAPSFYMTRGSLMRTISRHRRRIRNGEVR